MSRLLGPSSLSHHPHLHLHLLLPSPVLPHPHPHPSFTSSLSLLQSHETMITLTMAAGRAALIVKVRSSSSVALSGVAGWQRRGRWVCRHQPLPFRTHRNIAAITTRPRTRSHISRPLCLRVSTSRPVLPEQGAQVVLVRWSRMCGRGYCGGRGASGACAAVVPAVWAWMLLWRMDALGADTGVRIANVALSGDNTITEASQLQICSCLDRCQEVKLAACVGD